MSDVVPVVPELLVPLATMAPTQAQAGGRTARTGHVKVMTWTLCGRVAAVSCGRTVHCEGGKHRRLVTGARVSGWHPPAARSATNIGIETVVDVATVQWTGKLGWHVTGTFPTIARAIARGYNVGNGLAVRWAAAMVLRKVA